MLNEVPPQETEVVAKAKRRSFTATYKRDIIRQADACSQPGQLGALLRREGLYSSHLSTWRRELQDKELAALAPSKRGPKAASLDPRDQELASLRRDNAKLLLRAERAEMLVEIQKKVSMLLGLELPRTDEPR
jgi:transposase-like protein